MSLHLSQFEHLLTSLVIKKFTLSEADLLCTDDYIWWCHSVIADFMIDYEKQIMIAEIKNDQQCSICRIWSGKHKNLADRSHFFQNHNFMQEQIHKQQRNSREYSSTHSDWVQFWDNFAWKHDLVNIHNEIMINKLHQLYKSIVKYTI